VNEPLGADGKTFFQTLLEEAVDPRTTREASGMLEILQGLSVIVDSSGYVDPDASIRELGECEKLIDQRFDMLAGPFWEALAKDMPNGFDRKMLRENWMHAHEWLKYARILRDRAFAEEQRSSVSPAAADKTREKLAEGTRLHPHEKPLRDVK
jgi:hypothetical protein